MEQLDLNNQLLNDNYYYIYGHLHQMYIHFL